MKNSRGVSKNRKRLQTNISGKYAGLIVVGAIILVLGAKVGFDRFVDAAVTGTYPDPKWAGYAATGKTFTKVSGVFYVPKTSCASTSQNGKVEFWVGLDGWGGLDNQKVEQVGIEAYCNGTTPKFAAWSEAWPSEPSINTKWDNGTITLHANDRLSAYVLWSSATKFKFSLTDTTTGVTVFRSNVAVAGAARATAEWIVERPCGSACGNYNLLDWAPSNSMGFYDVQAATGSGGSGLQNANKFDLAKINMYSNGHNLATPGSITNDVQGINQFRVDWLAAK